MSTCKVVGTLAKYATPLNLVLITDDFGDIALNLSIARSTLNGGDAKDTIYGLAAFGASHRLVRFAWGPAKAMRSVGVRMIDNVRDYTNSIFFVLITSLPFFAFMILASTTSFGGFVSGIRPETQTGIYLSQSLFYMSILPFIQAFCRLHGRTFIVVPTLSYCVLCCSGDLGWANLFYCCLVVHIQFAHKNDCATDGTCILVSFVKY